MVLMTMVLTAGGRARRSAGSRGARRGRVEPLVAAEGEASAGSAARRGGPVLARECAGPIRASRASPPDERAASAVLRPDQAVRTPTKPAVVGIIPWVMVNTLGLLSSFGARRT
jgi:hypothetical protein